ncbi:MAG: hypothetical protein OHK0013_44560 [Sandaracinaceae bacterium]
MNADWSPEATNVDLGQLARASLEPELQARRALPAQGGDFENAPTNVRHDLLAPPTLVQAGAPYGLFGGDPDPLQRMVTTAWENSLASPGLRRQARLADRVLVVVPSGAITVPELRELRLRLGRDGGVGFVVVGLTPDLAMLPDRCGPVEAFWAATRQGNEA